MNRGTGLRRGAPLSQFSEKRRQQFEDQGFPLNSTFTPKPSVLARAADDKPRPASRRGRYTGPKKSVNETVDARAERICEWPDCWQPQDDRHHRLNRKAGGRHGEMAERLNQPVWLLGVCRAHHDMVTNPVGKLRKLCEQWGWILREGQDATAVAVMTRHSAEPVWIDNQGRWHLYEDGAA